jgi:PAS domain S-box-containing protein
MGGFGVTARGGSRSRGSLRSHRLPGGAGERHDRTLEPTGMSAQIDPARESGAAAKVDPEKLFDSLFRIGSALTSELELEKIVQRLTDEGTALCRAAFGAFFYTVVSPQQESLVLYALSGAPREAFSRFPIPRRTALFGPIFRGEAVVRLDDVTTDPRYGKNPPHHGMPKGHLPVRSYLALPVVSRSGEVLGGLFFGHPEPGVFTALDERLLQIVASQAAIAIDNARLYGAARNSEQRFRSLVVSTAQIVWTATPGGLTFEDSPSLRGFTGQTLEAYLGWGWLAAVHPEDRQRTMDEWSRAVANKAPYRVEYRLRRFDGVYRHTVVNGTAVLAEDGSVREWVGTVTDVTEQRRGEARLELLAEASRILVASVDVGRSLDELVRLVVPGHATWCAIDLLGEDGSLRRVAVRHHAEACIAAVRELSRYAAPRPDSAVGVAAVLATGRPELVRVVDARYLDALAGDPAHRRLLEELELCSSAIAPLVIEDRTIGALSFGLSGSERRYDPADLLLVEELARRMAFALERARLYAEARRAVRVRDEFLSIAGHELKTPLTALQLQVEGLRRHAVRESFGPAEVRLVERLDKIGGCVGRIHRLIEELLDVSKITAGRLDLRREEVDLAALAREVVEHFSDQLERAGVPLSLDAPAPVVGSWDRSRLEQVLTNLVSNAIRYGAKNPIAISVESSASGARLRVQDSGIGIAPTDLERVFERFERGVSTRHFGGLGLGLWIVRQIVEAHGGRIRIESTVDLGTTFEVELPFGRAET